jgi:hypothetical protein
MNQWVVLFLSSKYTAKYFLEFRSTILVLRKNPTNHLSILRAMEILLPFYLEDTMPSPEGKKA